MRQALKIGIAGLFGCGKTSLALRLAPRYDRGIAYLSGDLLLEKNIAKVAGAVDRYVLEHIDLPSLVLEKNIELDALIFINVPVSVCVERCCNRPNHTCNPICEFETLYKKIYGQFCKVSKMKDIFCRELTSCEMQKIWSEDMHDEVLFTYLFKDVPHILEKYGVIGAHN